MIFSKERGVSQVSLVETFCLLSDNSASERVASSSNYRGTRAALRCRRGNDRSLRDTEPLELARNAWEHSLWNCGRLRGARYDSIRLPTADYRENEHHPRDQNDLCEIGSEKLALRRSVVHAAGSSQLSNDD